MDTGTHLVMGFGLAGLAAADPVAASEPAVFAAVMAGTVIGSQAPDFDGLMRLRGNAAYIKHHRGASHSLPAIIIWAVLITVVLQAVYRGSLPWLTVGGWVLLSVVIHVFTDLFNTYGTQAFRPFTDKWIAWSIIHIFDPFIFTSHVVALLLWGLLGMQPNILFPSLYAALAVYYIWRTYTHRKLSAMLPRLDPDHKEGERYLLIPTISLYDWNIVKSMENSSFAIGELKRGKLRWVDKVACSDHPAALHSKSDKTIQAFRYLTDFACAEVKEHSWGYEVRWSDVRYRYRKQYPFVGVLVMDRDYKTVGHYVGWLSDDRLQKRLRINSY